MASIICTADNYVNVCNIISVGNIVYSEMCGYNYGVHEDNNETLCSSQQVSVLETFMFIRSRKTNDTLKNHPV